MSSRVINPTKFFRIADLILAVSLLLLSGFSFSYFSGVSGNTAVLFVNNIKYASYHLGSGMQIRTINAGEGRFKLEYGEGKIRVLRSPCHHKICVKQGFIHKTHKQIICVPYKFLVRIENNFGKSEGDADTDATTF